MIGGSAFELIEQSLSQHFISGGFTNRIEWLSRRRKRSDLHIQASRKSNGWTECIDAVKNIRDSYGYRTKFQNDR